MQLTTSFRVICAQTTPWVVLALLLMTAGCNRGDSSRESDYGNDSAAPSRERTTRDVAVWPDGTEPTNGTVEGGGPGSDGGSGIPIDSGTSTDPATATADVPPETEVAPIEAPKLPVPVQAASKSVTSRRTVAAAAPPTVARLSSRPSALMAPRTALRSLHLSPAAATPLRAPAPPQVDEVAIPMAAKAMSVETAVAMAPQPRFPTASPMMARMEAVGPTASPVIDPFVDPTVEPGSGAPATAPMPDPETQPTTGEPEPGAGSEPNPEGPTDADTSAHSQYDTVQVYYATDRQATNVAAGRPHPAWPLTVAGLTFGCYVMGFMLPNGGRRFFTYLGHFGVLAVVAVTSYVAIQWERSKDLEFNDRVIYGNSRATDSALDLGICEVTIPKSHQIGMVESPSLLRLEIRHDKQRHMVLDRVDRLQDDEFYTRLNAAVRAAKRPEVFVFVHGYNVEFDDAALRTAQLAYDLEYDGTPICYSWPSQGGLLKYTIDETNVVWTVPHLKQFLLDVANNSGAEAVNLVAHSMGNRALTAALRELELELGARAALFNNVVLAAPDVDAAVFRQLAPSIARTARHVTLYASSNDNALIASKKVHGYPRAGESGAHLVIMPEIETIDVSTIDTSLLGHSYYGDSDTIIADMYHLVMQSLPARERRWLEPRSMDGLTYWVFHRRSMSDAQIGQVGSAPSLVR